jgi:hypothetical protein
MVQKVPCATVPYVLWPGPPCGAEGPLTPLAPRPDSTLPFPTQVTASRPTHRTRESTHRTHHAPSLQTQSQTRHQIAPNGWLGPPRIYLPLHVPLPTTDNHHRRNTPRQAHQTRLRSTSNKHHVVYPRPSLLAS